MYEKQQSKKQLGEWGEKIAKLHCRGLGLEIEQANWRAGKRGEIDLIVLDHRQRLRIFVEVKTRNASRQGSALEAVNAVKQAQLHSLAEFYLQGPATVQYVDYDVRMDVIGITFPGNGKAALIDHIENAF